MKYLVGQLNYGGKAQRIEDLKIIDTVIEDLFSPTVVFNLEGIKPDFEHSHYGIPPLAADHL